MNAFTREFTLPQKIRNFFFAEEVPYGLALVRIILPWVLMLNAAPRWPHARELYSLDGAPSSLAENYGYYNLSPIFAAPIAIALSTALVFMLMALSAGWCTRFASVATFIIYTYFSWIDAISTATKFTVISSHLLLILSVSNCGAVWSVDYWLKNRRHRLLTGCDLYIDSLKSAVWPQRLMQLLIAVIYLGAAMTKFRTPTFFSGDQLMYWMMTYIYQQHWLGDYLSQYPIILVMGGYSTILWELAWVFCMWRPGFKLVALSLGVFFHAMTHSTLGLVSFPLVMIAAYFCHLEAEDARRWSGRLCALRKKYHWMSWLRAPAAIRTGALVSFSPSGDMTTRPAWGAVFAAALVAVIGIGLGAEWLHDPYRLRGTGGPLALTPIDDNEAERLFAADNVLRERDKFFALDVGTTIVGEHLLDRRREFQQGQKVFAQVSLNPPHEDLWVECQLFEAGKDPKRKFEAESEHGNSANDKLVPKKMVERAGMIFSRDAMRGTFTYHLGEQFAPGDYFFVVLSRGEQVLKKQITLRGKTATMSAN